MIRNFLRRLRRDQRGVNIVEFALIATPLFMTVLALVDLGFRQYMAAALQGTMDEAARKVTVGGASSTTINAFIADRMHRILPGATVSVTTSSYNNFSTVGKPEPITTDTPPLGVYNQGDCFLDLNNNGVWDSDSGASGYGTSDDILYYTATVTFPAIMPLGRMIGWATTEKVSVTTMMRNQPYGSQQAPVTVCT